MQTRDNYFHLEITSTSEKRHSRTRGPTRCLKLWNRDGKRIYVTTNESGQPVGDEASKLISFLGTVARDGLTAPLIYADWRAMPEANKEKMWQQVQVSGDHIASLSEVNVASPPKYIFSSCK